MTAPDRIYINKVHGQHPEDWDFTDGKYLTKKQLAAKVEYIRADLAALAPALTERAGEVLEALLHEERIATSAEAVDFRNTADLITALLAQNAALRADRDETYAYAKHLAEAMFANGKFDAPQWEPLEDTLGVLTQIDNMAAGIRARAAAAEAEVEKLRGAAIPEDKMLISKNPTRKQCIAFAEIAIRNVDYDGPWDELIDSIALALPALTTEERK